MSIAKGQYQPMKTVALLGKGSLAIRIAGYFVTPPEYRLVGVVPVLPEPEWSQSLQAWSRAAGAPLFEHHRDLPSGIDLVVSCFYDRILGAAFIARQKRVINLHNGPLPKYRGVNPINWALKNGEREHGVTIHEITPGIDDGPILGQMRYPIDPERDEVRDVYARALDFGWLLFEDVIPRIDRIRPVAQDDAEATYYSKADYPRLGDRQSWTRAEAQVIAGDEAGLSGVRS